MKYRKIVIISILLISAFSCKTHKDRIKGMVDKFADLECRAITLREKRFQLANQLRFTQDTLAQSKGSADTARLQSKIESYNREKQITLKYSLSLADSIHTLLDLMKSQLTNKQDREGFSQLLNTTLQERGCQK